MTQCQTDRKRLLEKSTIQVTVGLAPESLTPPGMREVSEEDIHKEEDREAANTLWHSLRSKDKGWVVNIILAAGLGFAICATLFLLGIFKIPSAAAPTTPITTPGPTNATAFPQVQAAIIWISQKLSGA